MADAKKRGARKAFVGGSTARKQRVIVSGRKGTQSRAQPRNTRDELGVLLELLAVEATLDSCRR